METRTDKNNMIFTRYLYNADEVCYTFLECLILNKNLDECYFWLECFNGLKKKHGNYYGKYTMILRSKLSQNEKKITQLYQRYKKDEDFTHIMFIVKNLFRFVNKDGKKIIDYKIFMNRVYYSKKLVYIFKDKNTKQIEKYNCKTKYEKLLVKSILLNCDKSISYYLHKCIDSPTLISLLEKVCKKKFKLNKHYKNKYHVLLFEILINNNNGGYYYKKRRK